LRQRLGDPRAADALVDEMVDQKNPRSFQARLARAGYLKELALLQKQAKERASLLDRATRDVTYALVQLASGEADVLLAAAELAETKGKLASDPTEAKSHFDAARKHLERGTQLHATDVRLYLALARVELETGRRSQAVTCLRRSLELTTGQLQELWNVANMFIDGEAFAEARIVLERLRQEGFPAAPRDYLEARILVHDKKWYRASKILERIRPLLARLPELTIPADLFLGQCYERLGNPDLQLTAYQRAVAAEPLAVPGRAGLAAALFSLGRIDEALDEYRLLIPRAPAARIVVARLLYVRNLRLPLAERRWDQVEQLLHEAAQATPPSVQVPVLRAEVLVARGKPAEARQMLEAACDKESNAVELWTALAGLAERQGEADKGIRLLDEAARRLGASVELCTAQARYWARRRGTEARKALARLEQDLGKFTVDERERLLRELGDAYYVIGDLAGAERLWRRLAEQEPDQLHIRLLLFDLALRPGNEAALERILSEIRSIEGEEGPFWRYGEAARLILLARRGDKEKRLGEARQRLAEVAAQRPAWARVPLLEAGLEELDGNLERAVESYQRAIELGNRQPGIIRRVVQLLFERRRYAEAEQIIRKLLEQEHTPVSGDLGRLAAEIALRNQQHERALELASQVVPAASRDYRDHIWLGQILWALGQQAKAEDALRHAIELSDTTPDTWVALIQHLARTGQATKAEATVLEAQRKLAADRAPLALAQCYEAVGRKDEAEKHYRAALAARPDAVAILRSLADFYLRTGQPDQAEPHLRRIIALRGEALEGDGPWARRNLAVVLALRGGQQQLQEALALVERNLRLTPGAVEDQRARALVFAMQPGRRREAIRLFEDLLRRQLPTAEEQYLLARLYEADHDWPKARDRLLSLLTKSQDPNPMYIAQYIQGLLRRGETAEAQTWLTRLEKQEPASWRTLQIKVQLLKAQGKADEAVALLQAHARDRSGDILRVAALLEQLDQAPAAEATYRTYVAQSKEPRSVLILAEFLGRLQRVQEALHLCERAWSACPPEAVAATSVGVLRAGHGDAKQCQSVESRVQQVIAGNPKAPLLLLALAELQELQGRYAEAEASYRRILVQDGSNVLVLNNLAWLASLHSGNGPEGLELINRALELAGPVPALLDTRAAIYLVMGQANPAIQDLEEALAEAPTAAEYFHLAQAYYLSKNRNAAANALRRANASGFKAAGLHPLERTAYDQLVAELNPR
jgi:tetratricopeptide (TPR) repeat protein